MTDNITIKEILDQFNFNYSYILIVNYVIVHKVQSSSHDANKQY